MLARQRFARQVRRNAEKHGILKGLAQLVEKTESTGDRVALGSRPWLTFDAFGTAGSRR